MALGIENISTDLVGTTLGTSSRDVGTLCRHDNINKWSKWKPVKIPKIVGLTEADLISVNYGFNILPYSVTDPTSNDNFRDTAKWEYIKPTGTDSSPYRLGDFRGYDHTQTISPVTVSTSTNSFYWNIFVEARPTGHILPAYNLTGGTPINGGNASAVRAGDLKVGASSMLNCYLAAGIVVQTGQNSYIRGLSVGSQINGGSNGVYLDGTLNDLLYYFAINYGSGFYDIPIFLKTTPGTDYNNIVALPSNPTFRVTFEANKGLEFRPTPFNAPTVSSVQAVNISGSGLNFDLNHRYNGDVTSLTAHKSAVLAVANGTLVDLKIRLMVFGTNATANRKFRVGSMTLSSPLRGNSVYVPAQNVRVVEKFFGGSLSTVNQTYIGDLTIFEFTGANQGEYYVMEASFKMSIDTLKAQANTTNIQSLAYTLQLNGINYDLSESLNIRYQF